MTQAWKPKRIDGTRLRKYTCHRCHGTSMDADWLDHYVLRHLVRALAQGFPADAPVGSCESLAELARDCAGDVRTLIRAMMTIHILPRVKGERVSGPKDVEIDLVDSRERVLVRACAY